MPEQESRSLAPAIAVDLGRALRVGILGGIAAVFVCAIGMVEAFESRDIVVGITLGYIVLFATLITTAYLAGTLPVQLEGFEPTKRSWRNVAAGMIGGVTSGVALALFLAIVSKVETRRVFTNLSPRLVELLTFGRGVATGVLILLAAGVAIGLIVGVLQLMGDRLRKPLVQTAVTVVVVGLIESLLGPLFRGLGMSRARDFLYAPGGGLGAQGAAVVGAAALAGSLLGALKPLGLRTRYSNMPRGRRRVTNWILLAALVAVVLVLPLYIGSFITEVLNVAGIFLLMALGLNIVVGFAGLLDLGYVAFFAVGAYTTAKLTSGSAPGIHPELTFWAAIPFVILAAVLAGVIVGTPVLRMRGDYLAIVTLGFGEIARLLFLSDALRGSFGGAQGIINIPDITLGPLRIVSTTQYYYAIFLAIVLAAYVSTALQDSRIGRAWMAMREDEDVAEAMGVNIVTAKLWAFIIGAMLASVGGALFAVKIGSIFPHSFNVIVSITVLVVIIVGGLASMPGVVLGAFVLVGLPEVLREFEEYKFLLYGALLIFMMLKRPQGFIPSKRRAAELTEDEAIQEAWIQDQTGGPAAAPSGS